MSILALAPPPFPFSQVRPLAPPAGGARTPLPVKKRPRGAVIRRSAPGAGTFQEGGAAGAHLWPRSSGFNSAAGAARGFWRDRRERRDEKTAGRGRAEGAKGGVAVGSRKPSEQWKGSQFQSLKPWGQLSPRQNGGIKRVPISQRCRDLKSVECVPRRQAECDNAQLT